GATGANLSTATSLVLHWGINEIGLMNSGNWQQPPQSIWPAGTVSFGDNKAVETPMSKNPDGTWTVKVVTNDTTRSIHYVFHDGQPGTIAQAGNWHWSNNGNFNFYLVRPRDLGSRQVEFIFDPRSSRVGLSGVIDTVYLAGTFNSWANNSGGYVTNPVFAMNHWPDGTFRKVVTLPIGGQVEYKFVVKPNKWFSDPDNPLVDVSNNGNSILNVDSTAPAFVEFSPQSGFVDTLLPTSGLQINGLVLRGSKYGISPSSLSVSVDGVSVASSIDDSGHVTVNIPASIGYGEHNVSFSISDSSGATGTALYSFGIFPRSSGYIAVDPEGNDRGPGSYSYPAGYQPGSADIRMLRIYPSTAGDSLRFVLRFSNVTAGTGVSMIITSSVSANVISDPIVPDIQELDWQSKGIYFAIAPGQPAGKFNEAYSGRSPLTKLVSLNLNADAISSDSITFSVALSDIQSVLGSFTGKWYLCVFSYLVDGGGNVVKIDSLHGGSDSPGNPSVLDVLFLTPDQQRRLLSNYIPSYNKPVFAMLDNEGRGYHAIVASDLGLDYSSLPFVTILTQPAITHKGLWTISGNVTKVDGSIDSSITSVTFYLMQGNTGSVINQVPVSGGRFSQTIVLQPGDNRIQVRATNSLGKSAYSPAIHIQYAVEMSPVASIGFRDNGSTILVFGDSSKSKVGGDLKFLWRIDTVLSASRLTVPMNLTSRQISVPRPSVAGEYYFTLTVVDTANDTDITRSYFTYFKYGDSISVPSYNSVPRFVKSGRVYQIFLKSFTPQGTIAAASQQLEYIKNLGYNIIWLMPIMQNEYPIDAVGGGYDITNFYQVAPEYGTLDDFHNFIRKAHELGLRVILDITPNHVSPSHPWVKSVAQYREYSPYWDYLQHTFVDYTNQPDGYDEHLSQDGTYIHYSDWSLANLNWNDLDLRLAMLDVMNYWLNQGADGFRLDVYWGPHIRSGDAKFDIPLREAIKHRKMDSFILAEATGTGVGTEQYYADHGGGADAAYDRKLWRVMANGGVQNGATPFSGGFISNMDNQVHNGNYYPGPNSYFLRYLENQDESRISYVYSNLYQTMPLATVLMTVPGIPMIYAGQEVGFGAGMDQFAGRRFNIVFRTPYTSLLLPHYEKLAWIRGLFPAFYSQEIKTLSTGNSLIYGFVRPYVNQNAIVLANFSGSSGIATVVIKGGNDVYFSDGAIDGKQYYLNDLYSDSSSVINFSGGQAMFTATLPPYGSAVYILSDSLIRLSIPVITSINDRISSGSVPQKFALMQNYPNPFNPSTTIKYSVPTNSFVRLEVFNSLGQLVRTLINEEQNAGTYQVIFDGKDLASGVYFYRLLAGGFSMTRKMVLTK
ncbi:MAG: alpha-amylase family glycosyl hydrolase, partial [Candidatus Kryptoniota bacterium]